MLQMADVPRPKRHHRHVLVNIMYAGVNMVDTVERRGLFQETPRTTPYTPGLEAAGIVEAVGAGVSGFRPGDRVAYMQFLTASYAEFAVVSQDLLFKVPDDIALEVAAGMTETRADGALSHS